MFAEPTPKRKCYRKLNFNSPTPQIVEVERSEEVQESPPATPSPSKSNFPASWCFGGCDLEKRLEAFREDLAAISKPPMPSAVQIDNSVRTEYRKMLTAMNIIKDVKLHQGRQIEWMRHALRMHEHDQLNLQTRRAELEKKLDQLKDHLIRLNANITKNTQKAVKTIIDIREEVGDEDEWDCEEEYKQYTQISRLCETALQSFDDLMTSTKIMKHECSMIRRKIKVIKKHKKLSKSPESQKILDDASDKIKSLPLDSLRKILQSGNQESKFS